MFQVEHVSVTLLGHSACSRWNTSQSPCWDTQHVPGGTRLSHLAGHSACSRWNMPRAPSSFRTSLQPSHPKKTHF